MGEWSLPWGKDGKGTNVIRPTLNDCVIVENFDGTPAIPLKGMSVSTFNARLNKWQQTWVDNQGSYLDFVGEYRNNQMILQRKAMWGNKYKHPTQETLDRLKAAGAKLYRTDLQGEIMIATDGNGYKISTEKSAKQKALWTGR